MFKEKFNTTIKLIICHSLYYSGVLHLFMKGFFMRKRGYPVVIINYHSFVKDLNRVMEPHPTVTHRLEDFKGEVSFLRKYFDVVSLDTAIGTLRQKKVFARPTVAITIDDGCKDNFDLLFPFLKESELPVTIFLTSGVIGTNQRIWVNHLGEMILKTHRNTVTLNGPFKAKTYALRTLGQRRQAYHEIVDKLKDINTVARDRYLNKIEQELGSPEHQSPLMLNWDEVRLMSRQNVSFGAHTVSHPILTNVPLEKAKKEILDSKNTIEKQLNHPVRHFAFPNGRPQDFNVELRKFCEDIGFESVSSCEYGNNQNAADVWSLKRIGSEIPLSLFAVNVVRAFLKAG